MAVLSLDKDIFELTKMSLSEIFFELNQHTDLQFIKEKNHVRFLQDYLGADGLDAKFAVVERDYINKDYLIDYTTYYSSCFDNFSKTCFRVHFFSSDKSLKDFKTQFYNLVIEGNKINIDNHQFWQESYVGYIVIKPIPNLFIGFTLLKHYNFNSKKKMF